MVPLLRLRNTLLFLAALFVLIRPSVASASSLPPAGCLYALDPSASRAFQIAGAPSVTTACGVVVESTAVDGFEMEGSETLSLQNHAQVDVVGGAQFNGQTYLLDTISNTHVSAVQVASPGDPLAAISAPTTGTIVSSTPASFDMNHRPTNNTLSPGVYCGGLTIGNTNGVTFTLSPGVYVMAGGGLTFNSQAVVTGTGVTVYNTSSAGWGCAATYSYTPVTISGQVTANLSAPTTGSLKGILFFGNRTGCATIGTCTDQINGGSTALLNGALYFKSDKITITGSNASGYLMLVADKIYINGNSTFGDTGDPYDGIGVSVSPATTSLYASQTQQFTATVTGTNTAVTWTISPSGTGTITSAGLYTAPSSITTQQTVTVTATSQADTTKSGTATVTLHPPVTVSVTPTTATLYGGQTQQLTASVANASNTAVTWSVTGGGTISAAGLYTAPASVAAKQVVTVTATSQANTAKSAAATITLNPPACTLNGYSYRRAIKIDHTQVPNTDQTDFPLLVSGTFPYLASVTSGGKVQSASGYDIIFTADAAGQSPLDSEIDSYTAATGASAFWVRIPTLSHTTDTTIYIWYGNAKVTTSQQNKAGVWRNKFLSVYHFGNGTTLGLSDSGSAGYTLSGQAAAAAGQIGGSASFPGDASFTTAEASVLTAEGVSAYPSGSSPVTLEAWFQVAPNYDGGEIFGYGDNSGQASRIGLFAYPFEAAVDFGSQLIYSYNDNFGSAWHHLVSVYPGGAIGTTSAGVQIYIDGALFPQYGAGQTFTPTLLPTELKIGGVPSTPYDNFFTGQVDEVRVSSGVRTADWVAAEYRNQSSPSTFLQVMAENAVVSPASITLYGSQQEQFVAVPATACPVAVTWSVTPANEGTISAAGLYTAPQSVASPATVTVTATTQATPAQTFTATVTLDPPVAVTVTPAAATIFGDKTLQLTATVANSANQEVIWTVSPSFWPENITATGLYQGDYTSTTQVVTATATSVADPSKSGSAKITVNPPVAVAVQPYFVALHPGQTQQFAATVTGTSNTAVTWSLQQPANGKVNASGLYTAPAVIPQQEADYLTASSVVEPNPTYNPATYIELLPPVSVSISPTTASLSALQIIQFSATVLNIASTSAVTWTVSPSGAGVIDQNGNYTAPAVVPAQQKVTITATSQEDPTKSATATLTLNPLTIAVAPASATTGGGQTVQYAATVTGNPNTAVTWSIAPAGLGTINAAGLYTPPALVSSTQTVAITATSQADTTKSATATLTLVPLTISVAPVTSILSANQTTQFSAQILHNSNTAVSWTASPAGVGTISATGVYTAPATINTTQPITITATSQADTTKSATATLTLSSRQCGSNGYGYQRVILIDHTQVANSDQINFPFAFNTTDPVFATVANGGHVANANGYDILFSTDPDGFTKLDHEMEQYNPVTGQVVAWVRIPTLSHTTDTVLYVFYGNPSITTSQQNPTGVWDPNYQAVYHLGNSGAAIGADSTLNLNNAPVNSVMAATGEVDGAGGFDGATSYMHIPSVAFPGPPAATDAPFTFSASFKTTTAGVILGHTGGWNTSQTSPNSIPSAFVPALYVDTNGSLEAFFFRIPYGPPQIVTATAYNDGLWHSATVTYLNQTETLYVDGQFAGTAHGVPFAYADTYGYLLGTGYTAGWQATTGSWMYFKGALDEVEVSNTSRSSDWILTQYRNQSAPATFYSLYPEAAEEIIPGSVSLYVSQSRQFLTVGTCNSAAIWSMPSGSLGTLTANGLYTAPESIDTQQTITLTATTLGASSTSLIATVTLLPPVTIGVTPFSATLITGQSQQLTASVANATNSGVTWTINPAGMGSISASGLYTAPASITSQQTVVVTATTLADPTKSASATLTLSPVAITPGAPPTTQCGTSGYSYQRSIVIDRTKVPNSDQINFPFLFNTTDLALASTANGGQVTSPSGYDIIFSTDPAGATKLDHEIEQYNPVTGQLIAWVRVPLLSHATDTVLYIFYGNANETGPQTNAAGVWDSTSQAVYHLGDAGAGTANDSTANKNNATPTSVVGATGEIDGAAALSGKSYIEIPPTDFPSFPTGLYQNGGYLNTANSTPFAATVGVWFKTASAGGILMQTGGQYCEASFFGLCYDTVNTLPGDFDPAGWYNLIEVNTDGQVVGGGVSTATTYTDNQWHFAAVSYAHDGTDTLYVDGKAIGTSTNEASGYSPTYAYFLGTNYTLLGEHGNSDWLYLQGSLDEVDIANTVRSADWIATQYNNQASPATFYQLSPVNAPSVLPSPVSLFATQTQQFAATGVCNAKLNWTMPAGSPGTLSGTGLYIAPAVVFSKQTVTVTATGQNGGSSIGSAVVTLLPAAAPIALAAAGKSPYAVGTSQTFNVTLSNQDGSPVAGSSVTFSVAGANSAAGAVTTNAGGIATFTYTGASAGTDTVVASAIVGGKPLSSNAVTATWTTPAPATVSATVTLLPEPTVGLGGLVGAFTDATGAVIEPVAIGAKAMKFVVPAGATQLQLGIDDAHFADNGGTGFTVAVNGTPVLVPATAMPWKWVTGGLNNNFQYGIADGTAPIVAATGLTAGSVVTVAYQSGTISTEFPVTPVVGAKGDPTSITGTTAYGGAYYPTLYTTPSAYPTAQPVPVDAFVTTTSGAPAANVAVTLNVTGTNIVHYQAITDSTGTAAFVYTGQSPGTDTLQATVMESGNLLVSAQGSLTWTSYTPPPAPGSIALSFFTVLNDDQFYTALVTDASGNPIVNTSVGFYVSGVDNFVEDTTTDTTGHTSLRNYYHSSAGTYNVQAVESNGRTVVFSNTITGVWTPPTGTSSCPSCNSINVSISAPIAVTMPATLPLTGTITDNVGIMPTALWTKASGPGTVTFANAAQAITTASFSEPGSYVLQLTGSDTGVSASSQYTVNVYAAPVVSNNVQQGWLGAPLYGASLTGIVPITVAPGTTLASGKLTYYAASDINQTSAVTLNAATVGTGQIGSFDTTLLKNGSYYIQLQATNSSGATETSLVLVTVSGNYKPGRVTASVTDLVVPATGLAIDIERQYDRLNAATSSDFGYGWSLGTRVDLSVDASYNVTFTLGGQRKTFYFTPQYNSLIFNYIAAYTPEPGLYGTLAFGAGGDFEQNCPLSVVVRDGPDWECTTGALYSPPSYIYTDPSGTQYAMGSDGTLQSVTDIGGNTLTITPSGITSSTGLSVPFVRDASGRITQITDPQGNNYLYTYDGAGNLATVTYPGTPQPSTYNYAAGHLYAGGTDFRSNPLPTTQYTADGRVQSVTNALGQTTSYTYNLATNTTTTTNPADANGNVGTSVAVYDFYGKLLSATDPLGLTTTSTYDANHNLTSVTDPLGHTNSYTYDASGNRTSSTYPQTATSTNTTSTTTYNQYAEPTSTTDELGNTRAFVYDADFWPQSVTDASGPVATFLFNANGTLVAGALGYDITQNPTAAAQFTYDSNGNRISQTDSLGRTTSFTYDSLGHKLTMTTPQPTAKNSAVSLATKSSLAAARQTKAVSQAAAAANALQTPTTTTYSYNALGLLIQSVGPLGQTQLYQYDSNGNLVSYTDPLGNVTTYQYDALNRLTVTTYPTTPATTSSSTYDFRGNVIDATDQSGHVTHHVYDLAGRLNSITYGFGSANPSTTTYTYYNDGKKQSETDALGNATNYTYDAAGHLLSVTGAQGNASWTYDNAGNQISYTDGSGNTTRFQYDSRKRVTKTTHPDATSAAYTYDGQGHIASITDENGHSVQYVHDSTGQLTSVVQTAHPNPANSTNFYGYDNAANLLFQTDENAHSTTGGYDLLGNLTSVALPDGSETESATYDLAGDILSWQHFNGKTTRYTYDSQYRLLTRTPDPSLGEPGVAFTYTPNGLPATMSDGSGTTTYTYDALDRLVAKATPEGTLSYTYDANGLLASLASSNPNGVSVAYAYDNLNRLTGVTDNRLPAGQNTTTYTYDGASYVVTAAYPNGLQSSFTWDSRHRLTALASPAASYSYALDPVGNRTSATETSGRTLSWSYDGVNRLTDESVAEDPAGRNGSVSYTLDPVGNRLAAASTLAGVASSSATYSPDDLLSTESYDLNGNVLATGGRSFAYDSENRLVAMNGGAAGSQVAIQYDGWGNRVAETVSGTTTRFLVDDLNPTGYPQVVEELVNGAVTRQSTNGLQRISENQTISGKWTPSFYGYDGMGNVRQLSNLAGTITDNYEYDAFGNVIVSTGSTPNNYLYRGEQYDATLGLQYLRARYYNPVTGRFLSKDPWPGTINDPASLHRYSYAEANPISGRDPSGLSDLVESNVLVTGIEGATAAASGLPSITKDVNCIFDTAAATLAAINNALQSGGSLESVNVDYGVCGAESAAGLGHPQPPPKQVPVHGPWHYGHFCGPGGMGTPINAVDAACQQHDLRFGQSGADWTNMHDDASWHRLNQQQQQAVKTANQELCDRMVEIYGDLPNGQFVQKHIAIEIWGFFQYFVPKGAQCHL